MLTAVTTLPGSAGSEAGFTTGKSVRILSAKEKDLPLVRPFLLAEVLGRYSNIGRVTGRIEGIRAATASAEGRIEPEASWQRQALTRRLSSGELGRLVEDYRCGDGCTVLAQRYSVSENGVLAHLKRVGVEVRPLGKVTAADCEEMQRLRQQGWTYRAIGDRFGVTRTAVSHRLAVLERLGAS